MLTCTVMMYLNDGIDQGDDVDNDDIICDYSGKCLLYCSSCCRGHSHFSFL